jgi:hypothetical protein
MFINYTTAKIEVEVVEPKFLESWHGEGVKK